MKSKYKQSFLAISLSLLAVCPSVQAARFLDTNGSWAETYINILSDKGIVAAESDGKFKPDDPVTRAVFAAWLVKILGIENQPVPPKPSFPDVKESDWFYKPVEIIRQNNYISGYSDGFRPNQFIQKGEVVSIISRALNKPAPDETQVEDELQKYKDASKVPSWARVGVAETSMAGILLVGPDTQKIGADQLASRADTIALLYKLDEYLSRRDESDVLKRASRNMGYGSYPQANNAQSYSGAYGGSSNYPGQVQGLGPGQGQGLGPGPGPGPGPGQSMGQGQYPNNYQGQVNKQSDYFGASTAPQGAYNGQNPQFGNMPPNGNQRGTASGGAALQGGVIVLAQGTKFRAELKNSIGSGSTQAGEEIRATINEPIYANGTEVIPAGSRLTGSASSVSPAHRFKAGAPGKMEIKFTTCETPDGRVFPLSASVDENDQRMSGSSTAGRIGKGLVTTGIGAGSGAAVGTALGAIVGGTSNGNMGTAIGMGAVFGTAIGAGVGGVTALVKKGSELKLAAGTLLPIKLDDQVPIQLPQGNGYNSAYQAPFSRPNQQPWNPPAQSQPAVPATQETSGKTSQGSKSAAKQTKQKHNKPTKQKNQAQPSTPSTPQSQQGAQQESGGSQAQGSSQASQGSPQTQQGSPQAAQGSPQTQQGSPQAWQGSPQASQGSPQTQQGSPQTQQGSPQTQQGSPQAQQGSPQAQQGSPQAQQGSPQAQQGSPQAQQGSPQTQQGSSESTQQEPPSSTSSTDAQSSVSEKANSSAADDAAVNNEPMNVLPAATGTADSSNDAKSSISTANSSGTKKDAKSKTAKATKQKSAK